MTVRSTLIKGDQKDQIDKEFKQSVVKPILKFHFKRDEFLGRINEFVYFLPFSDSELRQLVEFQLKMWKRISLEKHSIQLDWTEERVRIFFRACERHLRIFCDQRHANHVVLEQVETDLQMLPLWTCRLSKNVKSNPTKDVITVLTDGYDVSYGARSVKHETERKVVSKLAKAFEDGTLKKDMKIVMCCDLPENVQGMI